jgi:ubiquitin carboxyl-terminal hydrolase 4/11/15
VKSVEAWENHKKRNDSIVVDNFHAQLRSHLVCPNCNRSTVVFDPYVVISVPLARKRVTSVSILFVPLDFSQPRIILEVALPPAMDNASFSTAISELIGQPVLVAVGVMHSAEYVSWDLGWGASSGSTRDFVAFEIRSTEKFYIPCMVKMEMVGTYTWQTHVQKNVSGIFLVEFDNEAVQLEDVERAAEDALACVWDGSEFQATLEIEKLCQSVTLPTTALPDGKKLRAKLWYNDIGRDYRLSIMCRCAVTIEISSEFVTPESHFSVSSLARHYRLPVGRAEPSEMTLQQCFEFYACPEVLDEQNKWFCPHCRVFVQAEKTMNVWSVPPQLIVHLKRFTSREKIDTFVDFPVELDMEPYVVGPQRGVANLKYRLYGVSEHMGGMCGGHYTAHAFVREPGKSDGEWCSFDDSRASEATESRAKTRSAYVLFYERINE